MWNNFAILEQFVAFVALANLRYINALNNNNNNNNNDFYRPDALPAAQPTVSKH